MTPQEYLTQFLNKSVNMFVLDNKKSFFGARLLHISNFYFTVITLDRHFLQVPIDNAFNVTPTER